MSDFRTPVVFNRGKTDERVVVFNEDAPTRAHSFAADCVVWLLTYVGGAGWALAWLVSLFALLGMAGEMSTTYDQTTLWVFAAISIACLKPALPVAMKMTHERGEAAAWMLACGMLCVCMLLSVIASAAMFGQGYGVLASVPGRVPRVINGAAGLWIAIAFEVFVASMPFVIVTALKAMRASYERPAEQVKQAPALLQPSVSSFEAGFSRWAMSSIETDISGRLRSPDAYKHFVDWARYNGPFMIPTQEVFGKALADHCRARGAVFGLTNGHKVYQGVKIAAALPKLELPAIA